jgi:hypothetical protein
MFLNFSLKNGRTELGVVCYMPVIQLLRNYSYLQRGITVLGQPRQKKLARTSLKKQAGHGGANL